MLVSSSYLNVPLSSIYMDEERQREDLANIDELASSIERHGLIHPVLLKEEPGGWYKLISGARRFHAHKKLAELSSPYDTIKAVLTADAITGEDEQILELVENAKRENISWQETARAVLKYHQLMKEKEPDWSTPDTAAGLAFSEPSIRGYLDVAESELDLEQYTTFNQARNTLARQRDRKRNQLRDKVERDVGEAVVDNPNLTDEEPDDPDDPGESGELNESLSPVMVADFTEWVKTYSGPRFSVIHCDFPYGININDARITYSPSRLSYPDDPDLFWTLIDTLKENVDNLCTYDCHIIMWCAVKNLARTMEALRDTFYVHHFPLVWHKTDNAGTFGDPNRYPRHTHEMALFCTRGDPKLVKMKADSYGGPTQKSQRQHLSMKPIPMLEHFLSMIVDSTTTFLDPTAGSGNSLVAAERLNAHLVQGLEIEQEIADYANWNVIGERNKRTLSEGL